MTGRKRVCEGALEWKMDPFELTGRRILPVNIRIVQGSNIVPDASYSCC